MNLDPLFFSFCMFPNICEVSISVTRSNVESQPRAAARGQWNIAAALDTGKLVNSARIEERFLPLSKFHVLGEGGGRR